MSIDSADYKFARMLINIINNGEEINTRNSITKRLTNIQATFNSTPLISSRKTAWSSALLEMEWFLTGSSDINDLDKKVHKWWQPWANIAGIIKNNYSKQFRRFNGQYGDTDQIEYLIDTITNHPFSRRAVITTWNTNEMVNADTPITNCHGTIIQAFVNRNNTLHLTMYQRSSDMVLGLPHNLIQYWALMLWLAKQTDRLPGTFTWIGGDCHIYDSHYEVATKIFDVTMMYTIETPELVYNGKKGDPFRASDFILNGEYKPIITTPVKMIV